MIPYDPKDFTMAVNASWVMSRMMNNAELKEAGMYAKVVKIARHAGDIEFFKPLEESKIVEKFQKRIHDLDDPQRDIAICALASIGHATLMDWMLSAYPKTKTQNMFFECISAFILGSIAPDFAKNHLLDFLQKHKMMKPFLKKCTKKENRYALRHAPVDIYHHIAQIMKDDPAFFHAISDKQTTAWTSTLPQWRSFDSWMMQTHRFTTPRFMSDFDKDMIGQSLHTLYSFLQDYAKKDPDTIKFYENPWSVLMAIAAGLDPSHIDAAIFHARKKLPSSYFKNPSIEGLNQDFHKSFDFLTSGHTLMQFIKRSAQFDNAQRYVLMAEIFQMENSYIMDKDIEQKLFNSHYLKLLIGL